MSPDQYCNELAKRSGSSFYHSFRFATPQRRQAITALYAFCREVDDVVDETQDADSARHELEAWRARVERLYAGRPDHPVTCALATALRQFPLKKDLLLEIIAGMAMDLEKQRYLDFAELHLYCYRVASAVGLLVAEILGYRNLDTLAYAHDLGIAFQLTNIIRDVGEDARRGRCYLPQEELKRYGVSEDDLAVARYTENFRRLMRFQIERAENYYEQALSKLPRCDRQSQRIGLIMAAVYRALLKKIGRQGMSVLDTRIALPTWQKLWLVLRTRLLHG